MRSRRHRLRTRAGDRAGHAGGLRRWQQPHHHRRVVPAERPGPAARATIQVDDEDSGYWAFATSAASALLIGLDADRARRRGHEPRRDPAAGHLRRGRRLHRVVRVRRSDGSRRSAVAALLQPGHRQRRRLRLRRCARSVVAPVEKPSGCESSAFVAVAPLSVNPGPADLRLGSTRSRAARRTTSTDRHAGFRSSTSSPVPTPGAPVPGADALLGRCGLGGWRSADPPRQGCPSLPALPVHHQEYVLDPGRRDDARRLDRGQDAIEGSSASMPTS